jgi:hypothetical protein
MNEILAIYKWLHSEVGTQRGITVMFLEQVSSVGAGFWLGPNEE